MGKGEGRRLEFCWLPRSTAHSFNEKGKKKSGRNGRKEGKGGGMELKYTKTREMEGLYSYQKESGRRINALTS